MVRRSLVAFALSMALASPAFADVKAGVDAWAKGNYPGALKEWRPLAINGDADAQFNLGQAYKLGRGVPVDLLQAEDWYRRAALQGHMQAEDNFGLVQFQNGNRQKAMPWIEKSAARGEPRAQYILGTALFNGDLVTKDWVKAYALMTRASAAGLPAASASLGQMDRYIPVDRRQAGLAMARDMELASQRTALSSPTAPALAPPIQTTAATPRRPLPSSGPVQSVDLPPTEEPSYLPSEPSEPVFTPAPRPTPRPVALKPPVKVSAPAPRPTSSGKQWRVQLGAFGEESRARALFNQLESKVAALASLQPILVEAGAVTRLQAGPLPSSSAADQLCSKVRAAGQSCLVIAP